MVPRTRNGEKKISSINGVGKTILWTLTTFFLQKIKKQIMLFSLLAIFPLSIFEVIVNQQ
jgi:uncharacterized protein YydD (DUF2326 family)